MIRDDELGLLEDLCFDLSLKDFAKKAWSELEPGAPLVDGWALDAVCAHLEAVTAGEIDRLIINIPPGCTKSMLANVLWPAWEWRTRPWLRFISASYEQGLAVRDLVRCRDLVKSDWYRERWPIAFKADFDLKTVYFNEDTGFRFASSVGGSLTGYRGDRIVIDDPHSVKTAESDAHRVEALRWATETVPTRLNESKRVPSAIVVIMQRLHEMDVTGLYLTAEGDDWTHLCLPMEWEGENRSRTSVTWTSDLLGIDEPEAFEDPRGAAPERIPDVAGEERRDVECLLWPERFSRAKVEKLKKTFRALGGTYAEEAQLQQRPSPRGGGLFKASSFKICDEVPEGGVTVRGWDLAGTSKQENAQAAYTVGVLLRIVDEKLYVLDVVREQIDAGEVDELIVATAQRDGRQVEISIPQDPGQAGKHQVRYFAGKLHGFDIHFSPESGDKEIRARPFASQVNAGNVYLLRAPWNTAYIGEASGFPTGRFKDQIDGTTRAYSRLVTAEEPELDELSGGILL